MKILVIKSIDTPTDAIDTAKLADATKEHVFVNEFPRFTAGNEALQGWVILNGDKSPDFSWPDYTLTIGNVDLGRHKVTEKIMSTADITKHLIELYEQWDTEAEEE